ncbi:MAG: RagB/SusD family nutrient uptake outer membrane protein [Bacteroidetes bacterium]|nr:MAG: RagB/SusD family nutrient uptake outer membrane protein [Bacteroidota bacterium]
MKKIIKVLLIVSVFTSCKKFLDEKPDKSVAVPSTLQDMQAILDNQSNLNIAYSSLAEIAADDYYLTYADWAASSDNDRLNHIWDANAEYPNNWIGPYKALLYANTVLDNIENIPVTESNLNLWNNCKGQALFFRSFIFFQTAQLYSLPWENNGTHEGLGIPLRLTAAIDEPTIRSTIQQTYDQLIADATAAVSLLQTDNVVKTRPNKGAAFGLLARIYLSMRQYELAGRYADSCLQLYGQLIDYNTINAAATIPFLIFNPEVIFHSTSPGSSILNSARAKVDSVLFGSYMVNDLRRTVFFKNNGNGTYGFKGHYHGAVANSFFNGITTDEMWLIKAECLARTGSTGNAMAALNTLLIKRWKAGTFVPFTAGDATAALNIILSERRKELLFRGLRWQDLRRLNFETAYMKTLTRQLNLQVYSLVPGDLRYAMLIPSDVIKLTGIPQNPR